MTTIDILQIGAHVGKTSNDPIQTHMSQSQYLNCIFIEPVPYLAKQLTANQSHLMNDNCIQILNCAVSNKDGILDLYVPSEKNDFSKQPNYAWQLASSNESHVRKHFEDPTFIIDHVQVPCKRLNTLLEELNVSHVKSLYVDTEGHDFDILMDLDTNRWKPEMIVFENKHMDGTFLRGTKYQKLLSKFRQNGYSVTNQTLEDTTLHLIQKYTQNLSAQLEENLPKLQPEMPDGPMNCMEIGCFEGRGTNIIAKRLCTHAQSRQDAIDHFQDQYMDTSDTQLNKYNPWFRGQYHRFLANTSHLRCVNVVRGLSNDVVPTLPDNFYDFVYIDGDHTPEQVYRDAIMVWPKTKEGGIILFDDYLWKDVNTKEGVDRFVHEFKDHVRVLFSNYQLAIQKIHP